MIELPIVDISRLRSARLEERAAVAKDLGFACRDIGFFYVTGHDLTPEDLSALFDISRHFFALPESAKDALSIKLLDHEVGYIGLEDEQLDPESPNDYKEAFNIGLDLAPDHPDIVTKKPFRGPNVWPDLPGWREEALRAYKLFWRTGRLIHRGLSLDLGIAETFFDDKIDAPIGILRLLHYPARVNGAANQLGAGAHTDYGNLTLLATDGVAGLQVKLRSGKWIDAPTVQGALICNIGDCLMRWTGDTYVSTPHRVVRPSIDRYSVAFFLDPNPDARVETLPGFPARYPPTTGAAYLKARLDQTYGHRGATDERAKIG